MSANCHSCRLDMAIANQEARGCRITAGLHGSRRIRAAVIRWLEPFVLDDQDMPPRDSDGCPGYEPQEKP